MQHGQARKRTAALICGFRGRNVNSAVGISIQSSSYIYQYNEDLHFDFYQTFKQRGYT